MLVYDMMDIPLEKLPIIKLEDILNKKVPSIKSLAGHNEIIVTYAEGLIKGKLILQQQDEINEDNIQKVENIISGSQNAIAITNLWHDKNSLVYVTDENGKLFGAISPKNRGLEVLPQLRKLLPYPYVFESLHDAIIMIDHEATIIYANHAYSKLIGVPVGKIVGRKMYNVEPNSRCLKVLRGAPLIINQRIAIDSVGIEVIASITPIYDDKRMIGVVSVFRSIDETIKISTELKRMRDMANYLQSELDKKTTLPRAFSEIICQNGNMLEALSLSAKVACTNTTVMVRGENGVGKEILAKAIHNASNRKESPLIRVNCAAIPETLLESELFGYDEGAFTGARKGGKLGKFQLADGGTIFLDEIGDMSLTMQSKILRVIQEQEIQKVGGGNAIKVDVRIISATNRELENMVQEGLFREDLYYRLNVFPIFLPPLRERKDDIPLLVDHFVKLLVKKNNKKSILVSNGVLNLFFHHRWPGNVRELQNVLEHAVVLSTDGIIKVEHLPGYLRESIYITRQEDRVSTLPEMISNLEREAIIAALQSCKNNKSAAIKKLGISRRAFYQKLTRYNIEAK